MTLPAKVPTVCTASTRIITESLEGDFIVLGDVPLDAVKRLNLGGLAEQHSSADPTVSTQALDAPLIPGRGQHIVETGHQLNVLLTALVEQNRRAHALLGMQNASLVQNLDARVFAAAGSPNIKLKDLVIRGFDRRP